MALEINTEIATLLLSVPAHRFASVTVTKKGQSRKGQVFGDDRVVATVITGFNYHNLVQRSLDRLNKVAASLRGKFADVDDATFALAVEEQRASFEKTLAGERREVPFEPLVVDGLTVPGAKVYNAAPDESKERQEVPGTIYLDGLKIGQRIIEAAVNGPIPPAKSAPKTLVKNALRAALPVGRYVSYILRPGEDWQIRAGGAVLEQIDTEMARRAAEIAADEA